MPFTQNVSAAVPQAPGSRLQASGAFGVVVVLAAAVALLACAETPPAEPGADSTTGCAGRCIEALPSLTVADVERVLAQGIAEARARSVAATLAVVDRVGHVLAVYRMGIKSERKVLLATQVDGAGAAALGAGLEGIRLPVAAGIGAAAGAGAGVIGAAVNLDDLAAIAKAITGAFLSAEGHAFSTRTAGHIVQEHFNPGERDQPAGPLFGVQFSQLACSDVAQAASGPRAGPGPQRSPLGLSADPGGFPLYKSGAPVGGVGVMADGVYGIDRDVTDRDRDVDEAVAYAASHGFGAPLGRRANRITADGKTLRFSDTTAADLLVDPAAAPALASLAGGAGALAAVTGYFDGTIRAGSAFGEPASGVRADREGLFPGLDAFVLVDSGDRPRFAPRAGTDAPALGAATALSQAEVTELLRGALQTTARSRAQIRRPVGEPARVTISVVDTAGEILGLARSRDAAVFGIDVSVQKARTAALLSSPGAADFLSSLPPARYVRTPDTGVRADAAASLADYVGKLRAFTGDAAALADGRAYSARAAGNLSRPFYPDGIDSAAPGPLAKPSGPWSVLSTGLQLALSINAILQHILYAAGAPVPDVGPGCAGVGLADDLTPAATTAGVRLGNGLQIFPGGVPIYRGATLIGGIGVSGDGVDQDDMIAFLAVDVAAAMLGGASGTAIGNAPAGRRADALVPQGARLRYVQCPQAPFLGSNDEQHPCEGK